MGAMDPVGDGIALGTDGQIGRPHGQSTGHVVQRIVRAPSARARHRVGPHRAVRGGGGGAAGRGGQGRLGIVADQADVGRRQARHGGAVRHGQAGGGHLQRGLAYRQGARYVLEDVVVVDGAGAGHRVSPDGAGGGGGRRAGGGRRQRAGRARPHETRVRGVEPGYGRPVDHDGAGRRDGERRSRRPRCLVGLHGAGIARLPSRARCPVLVDCRAQRGHGGLEQHGRPVRDGADGRVPPERCHGLGGASLVESERPQQAAQARAGVDVVKAALQARSIGRDVVVTVVPPRTPAAAGAVEDVCSRPHRAVALVVAVVDGTAGPRRAYCPRTSRM